MDSSGIYIVSNQQIYELECTYLTSIPVNLGGHQPKMNPYQRFRHRLKGEPVDRPPNFDIMMTFAAHYIKQPLSNYYLDYHVLCDANFAVQESFNLDILQAISDPYREAHDFGLKVEFPEDGLPLAKIPLIQEASDLYKLKAPDPSNGKRMSDRLEAIRTFHQLAAGEIPVMGWVEGALAEAADLRGDSNILLDLYDRPEWMEELLETIVDVEIAFAQAQVEAGADIIGLGDAIASQISPSMYEKFALPYEQRIFAAVHEAGAIARLHICGDTSRIVPKMLHSGADIIDLDWMVDIRTAAEIYGNYPVICGNFDPVQVMLQGSIDEVYQATNYCLQHGGPRLISGAGCEIPDSTPHENLFAQSRAIADFVSEM
jgi:MtaA/CmuA family methyltransferase